MCFTLITIKTWMDVMAVITLSWFFLSLLILILFIYFSKRKRTANLPPLAGGALPIVGHTFLLLANRKKLYQIFADTLLGPGLKNGTGAATIRIGNWNQYVLMDPDDSYLLANTCLNKDPMIYGFFKPMFGENGVFTADVPVWKRHRKLLSPTLSQSVLNTYLTEFNDRSRKLVGDLMQEAGKGLFDQLPYLRQTVLQIIYATMIGINLNEEDLTEKFGTAVREFTSCVVERTTNILLRNDFLFSLSNLKKKQDEATKYLTEVFYKIITTKKSKLIAQEESEFIDTSKSRFKSFVDLLLDLSKDGTLTESEIQEELYTFIGAAFDTTYHTLGTTLLTLGSYPEVQEKVYKEHQEIFGGIDRDVEKQDLSKLKYLEAVIKETMRLYPAVFIIGRILDTDLIFKNYTLPTGSSCYMSIYHLCRHPAWGPDVEHFRPERWLDGSLPSNVTKAYAVFGLGKRSCLGSNFAMMLMKTILSHLVRRYSISGDVTQLVQKLDIVITPVSGHHIRIERKELMGEL